MPKTTPIGHAINDWTSAPASDEVLDNRRSNHVTSDLTAMAKSHTVYGTLLVLPSKLWDSPWWREPYSASDRETLNAHLKARLKITHIALTLPIPPTTSRSSPSPAETNAPPSRENVMRAPVNFQPLSGDFGPRTAECPPDEADFEAAYWTTARQNGLVQTWAPQWTMFSRGNVKEKARLLSLPSITETVQTGRENGRGCCAVDLYAGIGYFSFSYVKAGCRKVLGWEISGWSVEGLRRGAWGNGFGIATVVSGQSGEGDGEAEVRGKLEAAVQDEETRLLVFQESNEFALQRIEAARGILPPVRHVNCGLLPTSRGSWATALGALDPEEGGWVHVHENFATAAIEEKAEEVRVAFHGMLRENGDDRVVEVEHIERVKSYAPGVMHVVVDIHVPPVPRSVDVAVWPSVLSSFQRLCYMLRPSPRRTRTLFVKTSAFISTALKMPQRALEQHHSCSPQEPTQT